MKFSLHILLPVFFLASAQYACVESATTYVPEQTLFLPENHSGLGHGRAGLAAIEHTKVTLADNIDTATPDYKPRLNHDAFASALLEINLLPRIDAVCTGSSCGAKWQILGDSVNEAEEGNTSLALAAVYGETKSTSDFGHVVDAGRTEVETRNRRFDGSLLAGYRPHKTLLLYGGFGLNTIKTGFELTRTDADASVNRSSEKRDGQSQRFITGLHYSPGGVFYMQLEPAYIVSQLEGADTFYRMAYSGSIGWQW